MYIQFATCERKRALSFLQTAAPNDGITDTPESAGPLLDLVEKDVLRVQDPMMHGNKIAVVAGNKYDDSHEKNVQEVAAQFMRTIKVARTEKL